MRLIREAQYKRMPWKNGGGETAEVAIWPEGAALDAFDWRISMARVATDGPFSAFAGVDRTLAILEGGGLRLSIDGSEPATLVAGAPPHTFPADRPTAASLIDGPVRDLNVMTARERFTHRVGFERLAAPLTWRPVGTSAWLICAAGGARVACGSESVELGRYDSIDLGVVDRAVTVAPLGAAAVFLVELRGR